MVDYILNSEQNYKIVHYFADEPNGKFAYVDKPELYQTFVDISKSRKNVFSFIFEFPVFLFGIVCGISSSINKQNNSVSVLIIIKIFVFDLIDSNIESRDCDPICVLKKYNISADKNWMCFFNAILQ